MKRWIFVALCLLSASVQAGTACNEKQQTADTMRKAFQLAVQTRDRLDASGAQVALIARVGQDLSSYRLKYSHVAFAWRDHPQGRWLVMHELNQCGTANSSLYNEGLANFFYDDLFAWDAMIVIPSPALQARLVEELRQPALLKQLHQPRYSMVAYPFSTQYQNSNQWVLEILAAALQQNAGNADAENINSAINKTQVHQTPLDRATAQAWLKQAGYQPGMLRILALHRLAGRMFRANVAFDDHPGTDRLLGKIEVVTVESVTQFVRKQDTLSTMQTVSLQ